MIIISLWIDSKPAVYLLTACLSIPGICQLTKWFYVAMYLFSTSVSLMVWCLSNTTGKSLALLSTSSLWQHFKCVLNDYTDETVLGSCLLQVLSTDITVNILVESQLILDPYIGRRSVDTRLTVSQQSVNSQLTVGQPTASSRWEEHLTWLTIRHFVKFPWQLISTHFSPGYREGRENATQWLGWDLNPEVWTQCLPLLS